MVNLFRGRLHFLSDRRAGVPAHAPVAQGTVGAYGHAVAAVNAELLCIRGGFGHAMRFKFDDLCGAFVHTVTIAFALARVNVKKVQI
jgi:hypothetical protein